MIGIDEVGRGAWAGPLLVVAARQVSDLPVGLADSKRLTKRARAELVPDIQTACEIGEGWVEPSEIDTLGLTAAMRLGVLRALKAINATEAESIILDGHINYCDPLFTAVRCVIKADALHPIVSAASIYGKVTRDALMAAQDDHYPDHGFSSHVGYGTKTHRDALQAHGVTSLHRLSYKPLQAYL